MKKLNEYLCLIAHSGSYIAEGWFWLTISYLFSVDNIQFMVFLREKYIDLGVPNSSSITLGIFSADWHHKRDIPLIARIHYFET